MTQSIQGTTQFRSEPNPLDILGEVFIIGLEGLDLSKETAEFIRGAKIGGVVLNAQNYESPAQLAELINDIQACRSSNLPLWIAVDHEGGRVQKLKKLFTPIPDAATLGALDSPKVVFDLSELIAKELRAVGINLNFGPVADIASFSKHPFIGNRSFGANEEDVSKFVTAYVRGHIINRVQPCVKHFPGHGDTNQDSHQALPKIDTPIELLRERDLKPFLKAFKSRCAMTRTAHILYSQIDAQLPASLSPKILKDLLRGELRYNRIIISDELDAKAITDRFDPTEIPKLALNAGSDLLLYRTFSAARSAYQSLLGHLHSGGVASATLMTAATRIRALKQEVLLPYHDTVISDVGVTIGSADHLAFVQKLEEQSQSQPR